MNMPITIHDRTEGKRGCGYRKAGALYIVAGGVPMPCGKLPIPLTVCPTCSCGIKPSRGWTWIDADAIGANKPCAMSEKRPGCFICPLGGKLGRCGLLWVGEKYYPTPGAWTSESLRQGVSRRLAQIPKDMEIGKTWVLVAHRKAISVPCPQCISGQRRMKSLCEQCGGGAQVHTPAIFHAFKPTAIEYVLSGKESDEELQKLQKRGFTLVRVTRDDGKPLGAPIDDDEE